MPVTSMTQMWTLLQAHTFTPQGIERPVNHLNEWGGFSKKLGMPVFTAWKDHTVFDRAARTVTAQVSDTEWVSAVGVNNQERWVQFALENCDGMAAFFVIHAVNESAVPRKVKYIDADAAFVGKVHREGTKTFVVGQRKPL